VKGGHLKLELVTDRGEPLGGFAVGRGSAAAELRAAGRVWVEGDLRIDGWRGGNALELFVENLGVIS
jgi:hypothetical protein